ncbi:MAG TPA: YlmH/Sll1252 family protein [Candidatus Acidoferrum sp.]|nr:YlmH/Sll1252 family protein [Candidatus Acidoferrum sp.]
MQDEERQLKNRLYELSDRGGCSEFLTTGEQQVLSRTGLPCALEGGHPEAERRVADFGAAAKIACLEIAPLMEKFAGDVTHRDFLGALMGLGLRRETMGDIVLVGKRGYLFCLESVADFIMAQLSEVGRTRVKVTRGTLPEGAAALPEAVSVVVSSLRLDGLVAAVFDLSRAQSAELFAKERVLLGGTPAKGPAQEARAGDIISVRGFGRFRFDGEARETRKGRLRVMIRKY